MEGPIRLSYSTVIRHVSSIQGQRFPVPRALVKSCLSFLIVSLSEVHSSVGDVLTALVDNRERALLA